MGPELLLVATIASTAFSFIGGMQQAAQQEKLAKVQARNAEAIAEHNAMIQERTAEHNAKLAEQQAGQEQAKSQAEAERLRKQKRFAQSRATAIQGASGAGVFDPSALNILSELEEEGELNALNALASGDSAASILNQQAALDRFMGASGAQSSRFGGAVTAQNTLFEGKSRAAATRSEAFGVTMWKRRPKSSSSSR